MQERFSWGGGYKTLRGLAGGGGGVQGIHMQERFSWGGGGGGYKAFICKSSLKRPDSKFGSFMHCNSHFTILALLHIFTITVKILICT